MISVVKGFTQKKVSTLMKCSLVFNFNIVSCIPSLAVKWGWNIQQVNVNIAFLDDDLHEC